VKRILKFVAHLGNLFPGVEVLKD